MNDNPTATNEDCALAAQRVATPAAFAAFSSGGRWQLARHLAAVDRAVMDALAGRAPRLLLVEAPPRHGKSEFISRHLPAWYLGRFPARRVLLASYEAQFARSWGRKARALIEQHGRELFGVRLATRQTAAADWQIAGSGGGMVTAGAGGALTGRGADLLIVDDPIKNAEQAASQRLRDKLWDWWQSTASTRLEPGGCAIVMATRWHEDDLTGRLLRQQSVGQPLRRLSLPALAEAGDLLGRSPGEALWPERWPREVLLARRQTLDAYWWAALYQQRPARHQRSEWPDEYFGPHLWADQWPERFEAVAMACDPSKGGESKAGDYFAVVVAGLAGGLVWVDALMAQSGSVSEIVGRSIRLAARYRPQAVGVESNAFQHLLAPEFDRQAAEQGLPPAADSPGLQHPQQAADSHPAAGPLPGAAQTAVSRRRGLPHPGAAA